jgi:hypothetical protein
MDEEPNKMPLVRRPAVSEPLTEWTIQAKVVSDRIWHWGPLRLYPFSQSNISIEDM